MDLLQGGGRLGDSLRDIEAFGGADFGIDQPLLEVSQSSTKPLLQQALLVLTLPGCTEAETVGEEQRRVFNKVFTGSPTTDKNIKSLKAEETFNKTKRKSGS